MPHVVDESEIFSAARVQAVAGKVTGKVIKTVRTAADERCWPTFEVCVDMCKGNANDRITEDNCCRYITVTALHEAMARQRALAKIKFAGVVLEILCIHPGNAVKVS